jgi:hypothetical protein
MRLPRVRFTVRRMMIAVAVLAICVWLIVPAIRILSFSGRHRLNHVWRRPDGSFLVSGHPVTFSARYRHELLGLPWDCPHAMCKPDARDLREIDFGMTRGRKVLDGPVEVKVRGTHIFVEGSIAIVN